MEKNKKKKLPFNVLSKKGLMGLAMAGVMIATPFMLAGCSNGQDGKDGAPGTIWKSGTSYTEFTDAKLEITLLIQMTLFFIKKQLILGLS